jgi:hypothetical protein
MKDDGYLGHKNISWKKNTGEGIKDFKIDLFLVLLLSPFFSQDMRGGGKVNLA